MARAYALAIGVLAVALLGSVDPRLAVPSAIGACVVAALAPRRALPGRAPRRALALGAVLLAARVGLSSADGVAGASPGADAAAPGTRAGPLGGEVRSTIRLSGGRQDVLVELHDGSLAYARLPRFPEFVPGDRITMTGRMEALPEDPEPEAAGWVGYLRRIGVTTTVEARSVQDDGAADGPAAWLARARGAAGDTLGAALPEPEAGLAAGILVGLRERVDPTLAAEFTAAGLTHVVAISGWNIAIVGGVVGALARPLARRRRGLLIGLVIAAYTVFAGASPSVVRAAIMAGVALLAREGGRPAGAGRALALAIVVILLADPATVLDAGFQLSACATAGLITWSNGLGAWFERTVPAVPGPVRESLAVSLAAQAATLPVVLVDFGRLSLVSPIANLVVAPLVPFVMAGAASALPLGALLTAGLPPIVIGVPLALAGLPLGLLVGAARIAASVPYASVLLPPIVAIPAAVMTALALGVLVRARRP